MQEKETLHMSTCTCTCTVAYSLYCTLSSTPEASSAADLQRAAASMIAESGGRASALTHRIAGAGSGGRHRQNIARDISRALRLPLAPQLQPKLEPSLVGNLGAVPGLQTQILTSSRSYLYVPNC